MNDNNPQTTVRETPDKQLPALMDGDTVLLPATTLPLPLGGRSTNPGRDGEDDWADYAAEVLIPRWAVECIRDGLVWGQELEEDCDPDEGYFPIETMKERVEAILRSPGEMDKWKRIVGWGIDVVRHLDLDRANEWHGGLLELLALGDEKSISWTLRVAFSQKCSWFLAAAYWASWAKDGWAIVDQCLSKQEALDDACRETILRLVAEGRAYWERHALTGELTVIPNKIPGIRLFRRKRAWMNNDVSQMLTCLTELLTPPTKRQLSMETIWLVFGGNLAYFEACAEKGADAIQNSLRMQTIQAKNEALVADVQTRAAALEAERYRALGREDELRKALEREEQERKRAEENWREAEQMASVSAALSEERKRDKEEALQREREQAERAANAEGARDVWREVANGKIREAVHAAAAAHAAAVKGQVAAADARDAAVGTGKDARAAVRAAVAAKDAATDARDASVGTGKDARAAVRAAVAAKDAARGNKRESIYYPDLIDTFKEWEKEAAAKAIGKSYVEPEKVLRFAREDMGRKIGAMGKKKFWRCMGSGWIGTNRMPTSSRKSGMY